jgi:UDP-N-acetyl-D-galactosamine dehydrogenase
MGKYIAGEVVKRMIKKGHIIMDAKILILGITFKENCPDIRNSRVIDVINELQGFGLKLDVFDPMADSNEVKFEYDIDLVQNINSEYDAVLLAVAHDAFASLDYDSLKKSNNTIVYDIKSKLKHYDARL